eukprot:337464_1
MASSAMKTLISILVSVLIFCSVVMCSYWSIILWKIRNHPSYQRNYKLKVRRTGYILLSYALTLPLFLATAIVNIYMHLNDEQISTSFTIYNALHYISWIAFWLFLQSKVFKIWMIRYNYEYNKEMSNIEWKDHLGLRTVDPTSIFIRHRSLFGNTQFIGIIQLVILVILVMIQIIIREITKSQMNEQIVVILFVVFEYLTIIYLMNQIKYIYDHIDAKQEIKFECIVSGIVLFCWIVGIILYSVFIMDNIWLYSVLGNGLYAIWLVVICYFEIIWIIKKIDADNLYQHIDENNKVNSNEKEADLSSTLSFLLKTQIGFEAFIRFLVKENNVENLLFFVELSQYITNWWVTNSNKKKHFGEMIEPNIYLPLIWGFMRVNGEEYNIVIPQEIGVLVLCFFKKLYVNECVEQREFPYFENPEFEDKICHFEYLMQKYIYDSACLQISLPDDMEKVFLRVDIGDNEEINRMFALKVYIWNVLLDGFARFMQTEQYKIVHKRQPLLVYKDVAYTMYLSRTKYNDVYLTDFGNEYKVHPEGGSFLH